ncbi:hypothetical protein GCM10009759_06880 [Kitasatospora saccharophila]|uniref:Uncharacterized protein n=1 Tax=Kitasatospora saccharophila TaxID=407973 RepID=A0ABN2W8A8_9ACTN
MLGPVEVLGEGDGAVSVSVAGQVCDRLKLSFFESPPFTSAVAAVSLAPFADPT